MVISFTVVVSQTGTYVGVFRATNQVNINNEKKFFQMRLCIGLQSRNSFEGQTPVQEDKKYCFFRDCGLVLIFCVSDALVQDFNEPKTAEIFLNWKQNEEKLLIGATKFMMFQSQTMVTCNQRIRQARPCLQKWQEGVVRELRAHKSQLNLSPLEGAGTVASWKPFQDSGKTRR